jgi:hypothetical protein
MLSSVRELSWLRRRLRLPPNEIFDPLAEPSSANERVRLLEPAEMFERPLPEFADDDSAVHDFYSSHRVEQLTPTYVAEFDGGIAWGHPTGGVFTADREFVPALTHDPSGPTFHEVWRRFNLPASRPLAGRVLYLVTPEAADNYHHWLIDLLPRIGQVKRAGYRLEAFDHVIVNHRRRRFQLATLSHLGIPAEKLIEADANLWIRAEQLVVPSLKPNTQVLSRADVQFLRESFLPPADTLTTPRRKLFLSRADADCRRLTNEREITAALRAHDFEIITPSQLDVPGQARLFAEAAVIAGPAGAAFANIVFATAPAHVVEITPPQWLATFHWMISARLGLSHTILLGNGPVMHGVPDSSARVHDLTVDPAKLFRHLEGLPAAASV